MFWNIKEVLSSFAVRPAEGYIKLGDRDYILVSIDRMVNAEREVSRIFGDAIARMSLYNLGKYMGSCDAEHSFNRLNLKEPQEKFTHGPLFFMSLGIGGSKNS